MLAFYTQDVEQIDNIFKQSALYREKWNRADYKAMTINKALEGITATWQPRQHEEGQRYGVTQYEAARRFVDSNADDPTYKTLRKTKQPYVEQFKDGVWQRDSHLYELTKAVKKDVGHKLLGEVAEEADPARRDRLYALVKQLESKRGLTEITALVVMLLPEFLPDESNTKDDLLLVENGTLHLSSGFLSTPCQGHQFTFKSPVIFNPEARCPRWHQFINEFCCGDMKLISFLQSWLGYCCSGHVNEQKLAVFFGFGQNGKSVLLEVMKHILGGFSATTPADTLLQRKSEQSNDLAALEYTRFVVAVESDEGKALAEGRIKSLTGGDTVVCRKLFEEYREFKPHFKLNLATNSKPRVSGTDFGIWRRLLLIPCKAEIQNPDKHLPEKLKAEASGILNWLVEGFQNWQREGLIVPECVTTATNEYRAESDATGRFIIEACNPFQDDLKASTVYKAYSLWCVSEGHKPLSHTRFSQKMAEKGFSTIKKSAGMYYPDSLHQNRL